MLVCMYVCVSINRAFNSANIEKPFLPGGVKTILLVILVVYIRTYIHRNISHRFQAIVTCRWSWPLWAMSAASACIYSEPPLSRRLPFHEPSRVLNPFVISTHPQMQNMHAYIQKCILIGILCNTVLHTILYRMIYSLLLHTNTLYNSVHHNLFSTSLYSTLLFSSQFIVFTILTTEWK